MNAEATGQSPPWPELGDDSFQKTPWWVIDLGVCTYSIDTRREPWLFLPFDKAVPPFDRRTNSQVPADEDHLKVSPSMNIPKSIKSVQELSNSQPGLGLPMAKPHRVSGRLYTQEERDERSIMLLRSLVSRSPRVLQVFPRILRLVVATKEVAPRKCLRWTTTEYRYPRRHGT